MINLPPFTFSYLASREMPEMNKRTYVIIMNSRWLILAYSLLPITIPASRNGTDITCIFISSGFQSPDRISSSRMMVLRTTHTVEIVARKLTLSLIRLVR